MSDIHRMLKKVDFSLLPDDALSAICRAVTAEQSRRLALRSEEMPDTGNFLPKGAIQYTRLPNEGKKYNHRQLAYLNDLLNQDWSSLFSGDESRKYYVYAHHYTQGKPLRFHGKGIKMNLPGIPFYIGKGTGNRAFDLKRNQGHGRKIKDLLGAGCSPDDIVSIVMTNMTEPEALELESKLIYFFGTQYEMGRKGILLNLDVPARPKFI